MRKDYGISAIIIDRETRPEAKLMLTAFSPQEGLIYIFKKMSAKKTSLAPDLFDEIICTVQSAGENSPIRFLKDFEPAAQRAEIAGSYAKLCAACHIAAIAKLNGQNIDEKPEFARLLAKTFDAIKNAADADAVKIKFLYAFAKNQGYPVKEEFFNSLSAGDKESFTSIINTPASFIEPETSRSGKLIERVCRWIESSTDILLPKDT